MGSQTQLQCEQTCYTCTALNALRHRGWVGLHSSA